MRIFSVHVRGDTAMVRMFVLASMLTAGTALAAQAGNDFLFSPIPRWPDEPELDAVCAAMRQECPGIVPRSGDVNGDVEFDELFDSTGRLRGIRVTNSSGCRALDEYVVVSMRHYTNAMHREGQTDLGEYSLETPAGISPEGVRVVHHNRTSNNLGCGSG
jgi:hypothetical protein